MTIDACNIFRELVSAGFVYRSAVWLFDSVSIVFGRCNVIAVESGRAFHIVERLGTRKDSGFLYIFRQRYGSVVAVYCKAYGVSFLLHRMFRVVRFKDNFLYVRSNMKYLWSRDVADNAHFGPVYYSDRVDCDEIFVRRILSYRSGNAWSAP